MSRFFKIIGRVLGVLLVVVIGAVAAVYFASNSKLKKTFTVTARPVVIPTDAAAIAHGKHMAETRGCNECHGADYGGAKVIDDPAMGKLFGPNLTKGKGGSAATFRDEDWVRAIRHGVAKDGRGLLLMPSEEYSHFSDEDLGSVIAYLKTVPPVARDSVPLALGPVARALLAAGKLKLAAAQIDHANLRPQFVTPAVSLEYGRYLSVGCTGCHGTNFSGGKIDIGPPNWPHAANLTPHATGRVAKWTEADFLAAMRTGKRPDGAAIDPVMPRSFGNMTDVELKALWTHFKTLPATPTGAR
ncbi:MAG: c-type cytochrome [Opitutaceae bacterium]